MTKILVLGVGNLLMKDEGVGVQVAQEMMKLDLPANVEVVDGGTASLDMFHIIGEADRLIVIDALQGGHEPGAVYRVRPEDLTIPRPEFNISLHQSNLIETLLMIAEIGRRPPTIIIGVEPKEIVWDLELSPEIKARIPQIIQLVLDEIKAINNS